MTSASPPPSRPEPLITLTTADGARVEVSAATASSFGTVRNALETCGPEAAVPVPLVDESTLREMVALCELQSAESLRERLESSPADAVFRLAGAANFLECTSVLDAACDVAAALLREAVLAAGRDGLDQLRKRLGVAAADELSAEQTAAAVGEPDDTEDEPGGPPVPARQSSLSTLLGDDVLEAVLLRLDRPTLRRCKALSGSWLTRARRVLAGEAWHARRRHRTRAAYLSLRARSDTSMYDGGLFVDGDVRNEFNQGPMMVDFETETVRQLNGRFWSTSAWTLAQVHEHGVLHDDELELYWKSRGQEGPIFGFGRKHDVNLFFNGTMLECPDDGTRRLLPGDVTLASCGIKGGDTVFVVCADAATREDRATQLWRAARARDGADRWERESGGRVRWRMVADEERALSEALRRLELAPLEDVEPLGSALCSQEQVAAFLARRRGERAEGLCVKPRR